MTYEIWDKTSSLYFPIDRITPVTAERIFTLYPWAENEDALTVKEEDITIEFSQLKIALKAYHLDTSLTGDEAIAAIVAARTPVEPTPDEGSTDLTTYYEGIKEELEE